MAAITNESQINSCDTLLVGGSSFLSKAIKFFEKCDYSHAGLFMRLDVVTVINNVTYQPGLYVAEMIRQGLALTLFSTYVAGTSKLMILKPNKFKPNPDNYWVIIKKKLGHIGYAFFNLLVAQPIKYLTDYRLWLGDTNDNNPPRLICGEFVEECYNAENPDLFQNWKRDAPSDIFNSDLFDHYEYQRFNF